MKIDAALAAKCRSIIEPVKRGGSDNKLDAGYVNVVDEVKRQVGDDIEFADALTLCHLGFFMTHGSLSSGESMHAYDGKIFYEDGACLSTGGLIENPLEWMETGWRIKACPHEIDYAKLSTMHKNSAGHMLQSAITTYDSCIIKKEV